MRLQGLRQLAFPEEARDAAADADVAAHQPEALEPFKFYAKVALVPDSLGNGGGLELRAGLDACDPCEGRERENSWVLRPKELSTTLLSRSSLARSEPTKRRTAISETDGMM